MLIPILLAAGVIAFVLTQRRSPPLLPSPQRDDVTPEPQPPPDPVRVPPQIDPAVPRRPGRLLPLQIVLPRCPTPRLQGIRAVEAGQLLSQTLRCANLDLMRRAAELESQAVVAPPILPNPLWRALTLTSRELAAKNLLFEAERLRTLAQRPPVSSLARAEDLVAMANVMATLPSPADPLIVTGVASNPTVNAYGFTPVHFADLAARLREAGFVIHADQVETLSHRYSQRCYNKVTMAPVNCPQGYKAGDGI